MRNGVIHVSVHNHLDFYCVVIFVEIISICYFFAGKILTPKMTEMLEPLNDIDLAVVDVDSNIDLVNTFEVKAVPAILAFRNGVVVDKFIGLVDQTMIENLIQKLQKKKET